MLQTGWARFSGGVVNWYQRNFGSKREPQPLFAQQREKSDATIHDVALFWQNERISQTLLQVTLETVGWRKEGNEIRFSMQRNGQKEEYRFPAEEDWKQWLGKQEGIDIWEMQEEGTKAIRYFLKRLDPMEVVEVGKEELYKTLADRMGALWKITNGCETIYVRVSGSSCREVSFHNLCYIVTNLVSHDTRPEGKKGDRKAFTPQRRVSATPPSIAKWVSGTVLGYLVARFAPCPASGMTGVVAPEMTTLAYGSFLYSLALQRGYGREAALSCFTLTAGSSFYTGVASANSPPFPANPISTITLLPGEYLTLPYVEKTFEDPDGDTLQVSLQGPGFMTEHRANPTEKHLVSDYDLSSLFEVKKEIGLARNQTDLLIYNMTDPLQPVFLGSYPGRYYWGSIRDDKAYLAVINGGLEIVSLLDPLNPSQIGSLPLPPTDPCQLFLDPTRPIAWMSSGLTIFAVDISTPEIPTILGSYNATFFPGSITSFQEGMVAICGEWVWAAFPGGNGLGFEIIDGTDPSAIEGLGVYNTLEGIYDLEGRDGVLYAVTRWGSFRVFDLSNVTSPETLGSLGLSLGEASVVSSRGGYAYATEYSIGDAHAYLSIIPIKNPSFLTPMIRVPTFDNWVGSTLIVDQNRLFVPGLGYYVIEVNPVQLAFYPTVFDVGNHLVNISASDERGGTAYYTFQVVVLPPPSTMLLPSTQTSMLITPLTSEFAASSKGDTLLTIFLFSVLGVTGLGCCLGLGGGLYAGYMRRRAAVDTVPLKTMEGGHTVRSFALSADERKNLKGNFGGGAFSWIDFTLEEEREKLFKERGIRVNKEGILGGGHFSSIYVCWDNSEGKYLAAKKITGKEEYKASKREAELHQEARGIGVWDISHTIDDEKNMTIIQIMELARYDNLFTFRQRLRDNGMETEVETMTLWVGWQVLEALRRVHGKKIFHCDLKSINTLMDPDKLGISDFGKAIKSENGQIEGEHISDIQCMSPEWIDAQRKGGGTFDGAKNDAWALGALLLEFIEGKPFKEIFSVPSAKKLAEEDVYFAYRQRVKKFDVGERWKKPDKNSIYFVIKHLLNIDPTKRLSIDKAFQNPCFKNFDQTTIFNVLQDPKLLGVAVNSEKTPSPQTTEYANIPDNTYTGIPSIISEKQSDDYGAIPVNE